MFSSKLQVPMSKVVMLNIKLLRRVGVCYQIDQGETPWIHSPSQDSIQVRARHRQGFISLNLLYNCFKKGAALSLTKTSAPRIFQAAVLASYMLKYYLSVCPSIYLSVYLFIYLSVLVLHYPEQSAVLPVRFRVIVCTQQDVPGIEPGVILVQGKAAQHLVHSQAEVSVWCWH